LASSTGSPSEINDPAVIAEVTKAHERYEAALVGNDVAELNDLFWDSPEALRFGATESLYGAEEIAAFRRARSPVDLARTVHRFKAVTFGLDSAITTVEFARDVGGVSQRGRQTQIWRRFDAGWKIVSAHVSYVWDADAALEARASAAGFSIPPAHRAGVRENLSRLYAIAQLFLDFPLDDSVEAAPVFRP